MKKPLYFIILLLLLNFNASAQQLKKVFDTGLWTGVKVDYKFRKNFSLEFMQDLRLVHNFTKLDKLNSDIGVRYKINKNFNLASNLRYSYNLKETNVYSNDLRINFDLMFKVKLFKNFKLRYKARYQHQFNDFFSFSGSGYEATEANFRNKIQFDYTIKKHQIYFNTELFRAIKPSRMPYFNQLRFILGSKRKNKLGEFNYAIAYERELNKLEPLNYVFAKLYYTFEFKQGKKKQK